MTARTKHRTLVACALAALIITLSGTAFVLAEPVKIAPHKIVLNAEGKFDDVQAIVRMVLPSANIVDYDVDLSLDGVSVAKAESAFYCLIDDNLIVGFDRQDLQNNPDVTALAGQTVTATVAGWVEVAGGGTFDFSGTDLVEIVKSGKK